MVRVKPFHLENGCLSDVMLRGSGKADLEKHKHAKKTKLCPVGETLPFKARFLNKNNLDSFVIRNAKLI